jgi:hypothetical protein
MKLYIELMSATNWVNFEDKNEFNGYSGDEDLWESWVIYGVVSLGQDLATNSLKTSVFESQVMNVVKPTGCNPWA